MRDSIRILHKQHPATRRDRHVNPQPCWITSRGSPPSPHTLLPTQIPLRTDRLLPHAATCRRCYLPPAGMMLCHVACNDVILSGTLCLPLSTTSLHTATLEFTLATRCHPPRLCTADGTRRAPDGDRLRRRFTTPCSRAVLARSIHSRVVIATGGQQDGGKLCMLHAGRL